MGYGTKNDGHIKTFWPDDTDTEIYLAVGASLQEILNLTQSKWGNVDPSEIQIESKFIHTNCLTYDLMDFSDYTEFLCISRQAIEA
jgi:hypothetical protein